MSNRRKLSVATVQVAVVILGCWWGREYYPGKPPNAYTAVAGVAVVLLLVGSIAPLRDGDRDVMGYPRAVGIACLLYIVAMMLFEPLLFVENQWAVIRGALVLIPPLLAFSYLCRWRAWTSATGVALFVFDSAAMLASNASMSNAGNGFISYWRA
ncbi:MAG: hypothetical protein ACJ8C4_00305 [Gemmataceae bacterium]